jgi:hypothetical protein
MSDKEGVEILTLQRTQQFVPAESKIHNDGCTRQTSGNRQEISCLRGQTAKQSWSTVAACQSYPAESHVTFLRYVA